MERVGLVFKADTEVARSGNDVFRLGIRGTDGKEYTYTVFDEGMKETAKSLRNNNAKITINKKEGSKFWDLEAIEPATESAISKDKDRSDDTGRRITELANLKSACALVGSMCPQIKDIEKEADTVMKAGRLAIMVSGLFNNHVNRVTPPIETNKEEELFPEEEQLPPKPTPKPKQEDEKVQTFKITCTNAGYDINSKEGREKITVWLEGNFGVPTFSELTSEAQWSAVDKMRKETNAT